MSESELAAKLLSHDLAGRRERLGIGLAELSKRTGIPIQYLSKIENDEIKKPDPERMKKIDQELRILEMEPKEDLKTEPIPPRVEESPRSSEAPSPAPKSVESGETETKESPPEPKREGETLPRFPMIGGDHELDELKPYIDIMGYMKEKFEGRTPLAHRVVPITSPENIRTMTRLTPQEVRIITDLQWGANVFGKRWDPVKEWLKLYMEVKKSEEGKGIEEAIRFTAAISESRIFKWLVSQGEKVKEKGSGILGGQSK